MEGNLHTLLAPFSPPYPVSPSSFLAPTRSFVSSFNELSTNRDCCAFERDGGTIRGLIYQRCRQRIRYSFDISFVCKIVNNVFAIVIFMLAYVAWIKKYTYKVALIINKSRLIKSRCFHELKHAMNFSHILFIIIKYFCTYCIVKIYNI